MAQTVETLEGQAETSNNENPQVDQQSLVTGENIRIADDMESDAADVPDEILFDGMLIRAGAKDRTVAADSKIVTMRTSRNQLSKVRTPDPSAKTTLAHRVKPLETMTRKMMH